eukprot:scaffold308_cov176-Pinguiococcus_pyrenoidosus.AAC.2
MGSNQRNFPMFELRHAVWSHNPCVYISSQRFVTDGKSVGLEPFEEMWDHSLPHPERTCPSRLRPTVHPNYIYVQIISKSKDYSIQMRAHFFLKTRTEVPLSGALPPFYARSAALSKAGKALFVRLDPPLLSHPPQL